MLAASFAAEACNRGEPTLYFSMEESPDQILRNMRSIGIPLDRWSRKGLLHIHSSRPSMYGLEMHLMTLYKQIESMKPRAIVVDPITSLLSAGNPAETRSLLVRLIDLLKSRDITAYLTSLTTPGSPDETSEVGISSLIDSWIVLGDTRVSGERNRTLQIVKSRGMAHSNQIREFLLGDRGLRLLDAYLGENGVLTGSARLAQEARDRATEAGLLVDADRQRSNLLVEEQSLEAQISSLQSKLQSLGDERKQLSRLARDREGRTAQNRHEMALSRKTIDRAAELLTSNRRKGSNGR
jgi:circadian clock protein KaiC